MKFIYKNKITGLYYKHNDSGQNVDTKCLDESMIFTEIQWSLWADHFVYDKIPYNQELRKIKLEKLNEIYL